jgi:hypothetical protein
MHPVLDLSINKLHLSQVSKTVHYSIVVQLSCGGLTEMGNCLGKVPQSHCHRCPLRFPLWYKIDHLDGWADLILIELAKHKLYCSSSISHILNFLHSRFYVVEHARVGVCADVIWTRGDNGCSRSFIPSNSWIPPENLLLWRVAYGFCFCCEWVICWVVLSCVCWNSVTKSSSGECQYDNS